MVLQNATAEETSIDTTNDMGAKNLKKGRSGKRKTQEEIIAPFKEEIQELRELAKWWEGRAMGGAQGDLITWKQAAEEQRLARARQHKCDLKRVNGELVKLANLCTFNAEKRARAAEQKLTLVQRQLEQQGVLLRELEEQRSARVDADEHDAVLAQLADEQLKLRNLEADCKSNQTEEQAAQDDLQQRLLEQCEQLNALQHELDESTEMLHGERRHDRRADVRPRPRPYRQRGGALSTDEG